MANKYKILEEDNKQIFLNEPPYLHVLTVPNGWHLNSVLLAKKICDFLNDEWQSTQQASELEEYKSLYTEQESIIEPLHYRAILAEAEVSVQASRDRKTKGRHWLK